MEGLRPGIVLRRGTERVDMKKGAWASRKSPQGKKGQRRGAFEDLYVLLTIKLPSEL